MEGWRLAGQDEALSGAAAAELIEQQLKVGQCEFLFERAADASMTVVTNGTRAMVILWGQRGNDEGVAAVDPQAGLESEGGYVLANGQSDTYPDASTVPLAVALRAVRHVINTGQPDPSVVWHDWNAAP